MSTLAHVAFADLMELMEREGSIPSPQARVALLALMDAMEAALMGRLPPAFYLSSIDMGMGKSRAVKCLLKRWVASGRTPDSGVLICLFRLEDIRSYVMDLDLPRDSFAVIAKDPTYEELGSPDPSTAPILFITHERVRKSGRSALAWSYRGEPRALKVWDESFLPAEYVVLKLDELARLRALRPYADLFVGQLIGAMDAFEAAETGAIVQLPSALIKQARVASASYAATDEDKQLLNSLMGLDGQDLLLTRDRTGTVSLAGVKEFLPPDFKPLIILDASGRFRLTYRLLEQHRGTLERLPEAINDYSALTIKVWRASNGKALAAANAERTDMLDAVADRINAEPEKRWLVVFRLGDKRFEADLKARVAVDPERVSTINWGRHDATNEFRDVDRVILIGQLHYGLGGYPAMGLAASGLHPSDKRLPDDAELIDSEATHNVYQAIGRSAVRKSDNGRAGEVVVYARLNPSYPSLEALKSAFPGATTATWKQRKLAMPRKAQQFANELSRRFADPTVQRVSKGEVREAVGISSSNLSKVLNHQGFVEFLKVAGLRLRGRYFERTA